MLSAGCVCSRPDEQGIRMKICLVGSLVSYHTFDEIVRKSKEKPSNAPENFQMMLAKGLSHDGADVTVLAFPTMASYPNGAALLCHKSIEQIMSGVTSIHMPMINFQGLKQASIFVETYLGLKRWLKATKDEEQYVLIYSDYPPYASAARMACKGSKAKVVLVMTDLPTYKQAKHKISAYTLFMNYMDDRRERNFNKFDGYVVLTKHMVTRMNITDKPYIVVEGFSDPSVYEQIAPHKAARKTLMYAGALSQVHSIRKLIDGFMATEIDADLWIFGSGDQLQYVQDAAEKDSRIQYKGKVDRAELLQTQKDAHVLISVKATDDEHTLYAFPSKILEYMTSGTAVLTTRVGGIPEDYFTHVFTIDDESIEGIAKSITECLNKPVEELLAMGQSGHRFAADMKNTDIQGKKILDFLKKNFGK